MADYLQTRLASLPRWVIPAVLLLIAVMILVFVFWPQQSTSTAELRNMQRIVDVNNILRAITTSTNGHAGVRPGCLSAGDALVHPLCVMGSRCAGVANGCDLDVLTASGLATIPVDPSGALGNDTRYTVALDGSIVVVAAPAAENGEKITLMR